MVVTVRQFKPRSCLVSVSMCNKGMARPELSQKSSWAELPLGFAGGLRTRHVYYIIYIYLCIYIYIFYVYI